MRGFSFLVVARFYISLSKGDTQKIPSSFSQTIKKEGIAIDYSRSFSAYVVLQ